MPRRGWPSMVSRQDPPFRADVEISAPMSRSRDDAPQTSDLVVVFPIPFSFACCKSACKGSEQDGMEDQSCLIRALRTEMQPVRDRCGCQQRRPMLAIPHAVSWPAASSRRGLAASVQAGQSGRGHHDRPLDQAQVRAVCSPGNSCPFHPG
jgi:hypothetical protein